MKGIHDCSAQLKKFFLAQADIPKIEKRLDVWLFK
jgi:hypothetical protein